WPTAVNELQARCFHHKGTADTESTPPTTPARSERSFPSPCFCFSSLCSLCLCGSPTSRGVFQPQFVEVLFAVGRNVPSVGPEAKIDAPPVVRDARLVQIGDQLFEVQLSGAERI